MARTTITLTIDADSVAAGRASFAALNDLQPRMSVASLARLQALHDEVAGQPDGLITARTDERNVILEPSQRYLEDVAAIAADATHPEGALIEIEYRHGWPILSVAEPRDAGFTVLETRRFEKHEIAPFSPAMKA